MASTGGIARVQPYAELPRLRRILDAQLLDLIAKMGREDTAKDTGYTRLSGLLIEVGYIAPRCCAAPIARAEQVTETLTPTGT